MLFFCLVVGLFLPCGFSYRETFSNFLNCYKYAFYNFIEWSKC